MARYQLVNGRDLAIDTDHFIAEGADLEIQRSHSGN